MTEPKWKLERLKNGQYRLWLRNEKRRRWWWSEPSLPPWRLVGYYNSKLEALAIIQANVDPLAVVNVDTYDTLGNEYVVEPWPWPPFV